MRAVLSLLAIAVPALLPAGCGGGEATLESLAGTPAAIHIVRDVDAMAHACARRSEKAREAGVEAYADLAAITAVHPRATFGPEGSELTMRRLLRRTVERTGHCIGVFVDAHGRYYVD